MRRELVEKVTDFMQSSGLHTEGAIYPRRYFDDLIMEHQLADQIKRREQKIVMAQSLDAKGLKSAKATNLAFGLPSGKLTSQYHVNQFLKNKSSNNAGMSHRITDDTGTGSTHMQVQPSQINLAPQRRNYMPGLMTLDNDSEIDLSKINIRHSLQQI